MSDPADPIRFDVPHRPAGDKKKGLGRGLGALMGETRREEPLVVARDGGGESASAPSAYPKSGLASLAVAAIEPLPDQPRRHFDEAALDELAASIAARGVIQPVIVRPLAGANRHGGGERTGVGTSRQRCVCR